MPLVRSDPAGRARVIDTLPAIETCFGALYVPASERGWGVYDHGDRLVVSAARWMSDENGAPIPASGCWTAPVGPTAELSETFVYAGLLEADRTEFLVGVLSRCWSHVTSGARLLFHAREPLDRLFDAPIVMTTMAALGITSADCVVLATPTRLACVIVPAAALESGRLAYRAYAQVAATVAIRFAGRTVPVPLGRAPLHVSSAREPVPAFAGEEAFDRTLAANGVTVVHPSELSLPSLVAQMRAAGLLSSTSPDGIAGAGCQAAVFREAGTRIVLCNGTPATDSVNVDELSGQEAVYVRPVENVPDPDTLAAAYLRAMWRLIAVRRLPCDLGVRTAMPDLGLRAPACGTSGGDDGSALVGGLLTGSAQVVVSAGEYPWWQVDLGSVIPVGEVRVHGPIEGPERASVLRLFGSSDGRDWTMLADRGSDIAIGGIDGAPHRFVADERPWRARFLRLQSGTGVLALDQVEILTPSDVLVDEVLA